MTTNVIEVAIKATDQASNSLRNTSSNVLKLTGAVVAGAAAAAAGAVGFAKLVSKWSEAADEAGKMATRLGTTTETLTAMQGAAKLSDIATGDFNRAIETMNRNLGNAIVSGDASSKVLAQFGLKASELSRLPLDEKLNTVADAMAKIGNPAERAALATAVFGKSGSEMIQMLGGGSEALRRATADAVRFGVVISEDAAKKADELSDAFARVEMAGQGMMNTIAAKVSPIVTGVLNHFAEWLADNRDEIASWVDAVITGFLTAFVVVRNVLTQLMVNIGQVWDFISQIFEGDHNFIYNYVMNMTKAIWSFISWTVEQFAKFAAWLPKTIGTAGMLAGQLLFEGLQTALALIVDLAATVGKRILDALQGNVVEPLPKQMADAVARAMGDLESRTHDTLKDISKWGGETWEDVSSTAKTAWTAISDTAGGVLDTLTNLAKEWGDAIDLSDAIAEVQAWRDSANEAAVAGQNLMPKPDPDAAKSFFEVWKAEAVAFLESHKTATEEIAKSTFDLMMTTSGAIGDAFANAIVSGGNLGKALQNIGKQVLTSMISMLIRIGIQRLILHKLEKAIGVSSAMSKTAGGLSEVYINSFASAAAIPLVGWAMAPGVAAANLAAATAGAAGAAALGAGQGAAIGAAGAAAHGGMDFVPSESTYLLQRGERVLSPNQNKDFTDMVSGMKGSEESEVNIYIDEDNIHERVIRKLADGLNKAISKHGVRLNVNERSTKRTGKGG